MDPLNKEDIVQTALTKCREQLFTRGIKGLGSISRVFKIADFNGNRKLDIEEFEDCLNFAGLFMKKYELTALFRYFDRNDDGSIDYDEFLRALKGDMNDRRRAIVLKAFNIMDRDGSGYIDLADVKGVFNASKHPEVLLGKISADDALVTFLQGLEGRSGNGDGRISKEEWLDYYADLSASIPTDQYFVEMMESVWMISETGLSPEEEKRVDEFEGIMKEKIRQKSKGEAETVKLRQIFKFFDTDQSGHITVDEFKAACERLGLPLERRHARAFFMRYDPDRSGTISYDEFVDRLYGASVY